MMRKSAIILILAVLEMLPASVRSVGPATSIYVRANPDNIIADGKSVTTITAEVRDSDGNLVPNGTMVSFSTSLGAIESNVSTTAGVARARLTSGTATGTANVSAWVTQGGAVGQVRVELLAPGTEISRQTFITISSKNYLVYDTAKMVVYASGGTKIEHRGLSISAYEAQFDLQSGVVRCKAETGGDPVTITHSGKSLKALLLYYKTKDMKGKALFEGKSGKMERVNIRGADLAVEPDTEDIPPNLFDFVDLSADSVLIKASSITIRPSDEIQFRRAKFYVDGNKLLSMPLHVIPLGNSQSQASRYLGWGTTGLKVDLPFYYSLSPSSTGSLHLRRGQQTGWGFYSADAGWSVDMVQDYTTDSGGEGNFTLNRIISGDWGAHWDHRQELADGGSMYTYLDFPAHKDLFGTLNLSKPLQKASIGLNLYGNKYQGQSAGITSDLYLQSLPKKIAGGAASYVLLGRTSYSAGGGLTDGGIGAGLQMQLFGKPLTFSKRSGLSTSMSFGQDWGGARNGFSLMGNASFNYRMGQAGNFGLVYTYTRDPLYQSQLGSHRLSANVIYAPSQRWRAQLFSTYTLDAPMSSTFADVSYRIAGTWSINLLQTLQSSQMQSLGITNDYNFSDTEIGLGKKVGDHDVMLVWSKSRNRLRLEFNAARF